MSEEQDPRTQDPDPFSEVEYGREVRGRLNGSADEEWHRVELSVEGLSCAGEAAPLADRLKRIAGVQDAIVNPITERAVVRFDPDRAHVDAIVEVLVKRGLQTGDRIARLHAPIAEVDCASCRRGIEGSLRQVPGVGGVTVRSDGGGVTVVFVPALTDVAALRRHLLVRPVHL